MPLEIITLVDDASGTRACVLPGLGANCFSFTACPNAEPCEVLWSADDFATGNSRPVGSGLPILFPFAGRIRGGQFNWHERRFDLSAAPADGRGNAIHGFVADRPWRVVEQTGNDVLCEFQASRDAPHLLKQWPADYLIAVRHTVNSNVLTVAFQVRNPDQQLLPFALGTHGYFRAPLGPRGALDNCTVQIPAGAESELVDLLPTGRTLQTPIVGQLQTGLKLGAAPLDNVLTQLTSHGGRCKTTLDDAGGRRLTVEFDDCFTTCVAFTPPHRQAVCLEPYTTIPDPFWLLEQGHDPHLVQLAPGENWCASIALRCQ